MGRTYRMNWRDAKCIVVYVFIGILLTACLPALATGQPGVDPVSGQPMDGGLAVYYQQYFDTVYRKYEKELSLNERFAAISVYDAVADIDFEGDADESNRRRIMGLDSLENLKALLTGFYDPKDASYHADEAVEGRIKQILSACGLNREDYCLRVLRNMGALQKAPITDNNRYCVLGHWAEKLPYDASMAGFVDDMEIVLYGDGMKVGRFVMNPDD